MSRVETEDTGWEAFVIDLQAETLEDMEGAVLDAVLHLEMKVKENMGGNKTGRTYFVPGSRTTTYTASAPNETPASATGKARQNVQHTPVKVSGTDVEAGVGVDENVVPYFPRLEFGGFHVVPKTQAVRGPAGWFTVKAGTVIRTIARAPLRKTFNQEEQRVDQILRKRLTS